MPMLPKLHLKSGYILPALIFILLVPVYASAQKVRLTHTQSEFRLLESDQQAINFHNELASFSGIDVNTASGLFSELSVQGYNHSTEEGAPMLPVVKKLIELPYGAEAEVHLKNIRVQTISLQDNGIGNLLLPAQPPVSKSTDPDELPFIINKDIYQTDDWYGQELARVINLGTMRGVRIARLEIAPFLYNPVTGELRITTGFDCEITFKGALPEITGREKARVYSPWFEADFSRLINHQKPGTDGGDALIDVAPVTYIIVADPMFESALQPFIQWKTKKGFNVVEAYTNNPEVGSTTTSIRNYLSNFYQNPPVGYNPQTFVLIVGDVAQVPAFNGTAGSHVTDLYYCEYSGDDFPECFYGRFSANNLYELQPQIDKTLEYEQYQFPDPSFLDEVVMAAGADTYHQLTWGNGQINYGTQYYFNAAHGLYSHTYLQPEPSGGNYSQNIRQNVSDGIAYANYSAHCSAAGWADPSFTISNISALTNAHQYPLMVGNCCSSVEFQTTCFGEEILRAPLKGAVGYIGGSNSTYWDEDFWWGVGMEAISANPAYNPDHPGAYDRTFHDQPGLTTADWFITQGQMPSAGNLAVSQAGSTRETYYWEIYHLMGDPSLMIYLSQPPDITADYPEWMPVAAETFTVSTDPYAYVAISKDGILHGAAIAGSSGEAVVELDPITEPGEADVVITGQNLKPFMGTVMISSPNGAYVTLDSFQVDDTAGNNNGQADYGETIFLDVSMQNMGNEPGTNLTLNLSASGSYVDIIQPNATLAEIGAGETVPVNDAFEISIAEEVPDGEILPLLITVSDGSDNWESTFSVVVHAPILEYSDFAILDPAGNGNGKLDPGETAQLRVTIQNTGSSDAIDVMGMISSVSPFITINQSDPLPFGNLQPDESSTAAFEVTCSESTPGGTEIAFTLNLTAQMGISGQGSFSIIAGQIPVLIVDLDENNSSAGEIESAINSAGIAAEYSTVLPDNPEIYSSLFVCLGIYSNNHVLSTAEGQILADYLNNGGCLYMEGGDTWYYDGQTAVHPMFGIDGTSDGSGDLGTVLGVSGTMTEGMTFSYSGENNWIDHLAATGNGKLILKNQSPDYGCAVSNVQDGYKTIGASLEFSGLSGDRNALIEQFLMFFDLVDPPITQTIQVPQGWSGISGCVVPQNTNLNLIFGLNLPNVVMMQNENGVFYPDFQVNTIGEWNYREGYMIKADAPFNLNLTGTEPGSRQIVLSQGWNLMPVLSSCSVTVNQTFGLFLNQVQVIKSVAGNGVYWPDFNINTLGSLEPGKAYFVYVDQQITITFPDCD